ncbi:MAG TPA: endolytic transglycosylase MltG [Rhodanobacteraceae bacterium]|nr:endolytic transglycosylase MltG [Rhodanobacteraceae bacterium]
MRKQTGGAISRFLIVVFVLGLLGAAAFFWLDYRRFADAPLTVESANVTIDVARGSSYRTIVDQLRAAGLTRASPWYWRALGRELGIEGRVHAGEYALTPGITPRELLRRMVAGDVLKHYFTIVDGWTFRQLRLALASDAGLAQTMPGLADEDIAHRLDITQINPEGWFLPETYAWIKGESDFDVLSRAYAAMRKAIDRLWDARASDVVLDSPYQALILASIVEKETGRPDERPLIAGVFMRRLKSGMRLQTDPTVIYGMGENYRGNIRREDLETDTPYNTYTRDGLPPTPIALPGVPALKATLHPAPGDALYFVARGDGSHEFSATLEDHNRAVQKFQLHHKP